MAGESERCLVLGIDLDEVCADFVGGFNRRAYEVLGPDVIRTGKDYRWPCWAITDALNITPQQEQEVWNDIMTGFGFWSGLDVLPGVIRALDQLCRMEEYGQVRLIFVTARPEVAGNQTYLETVRWLQQYNMVPNPYVVIAHDKGAIVKALGITHFVDDKFQNCEAVRDAGAKTYFVRHPHGEQYIPQITGDITIINNLGEFAAHIAEAVAEEVGV